MAMVGCGGSAGNGGSGGGGTVAAAPTTLPAGATLGCDEAPADGCVYGGDASAPSGVFVGDVGKKIQADKFKLVDPMTLVKDASAPGGDYFQTPTGNQGDAIVAVKIPSDGYYDMWDATQSGDTTTNFDSFYLYLGASPDETLQDNDHAVDVSPDAVWHQHDTAGGCIQIRHTGTADAPDHCDAWHFKKGIVVIHIGGREATTHFAWLQVSPAK